MTYIAGRRLAARTTPDDIKRDPVSAWLRRSGLSVLRTLILFGIGYVIVFPLIGKFSISIMTRADMWDQTVSFIPKYPTLNNYKLAYEFMKYPWRFSTLLSYRFSWRSRKVLSPARS